MDTIRTETIIQAPAQTVWKALIDFSAWSQWNPMISRASGELRMGKSVAIRRKTKKTFHPTITYISRDQEFRWIGRGGPMGLLHVEHVFTLESIDEESTRFTQTETFSGWLTPILFDQIEDGVKGGFETMDGALKKRCENL